MLGEFSAQLKLRAQHPEETLRHVVARQDPGLVFDVVAEGDVCHVMDECSCTDDPLLVITDSPTSRNVDSGIPVDRIDQDLGHVQSADRVLEAAVSGPGEDEAREAQLLDPSEALHLGRVDNTPLSSAQVDVPMNRVAHDKVASGCHGGNDTLDEA